MTLRQDRANEWAHTLTMAFGMDENANTIKVKYLIVVIPSPYNIIMGADNPHLVGGCHIGLASEHEILETLREKWVGSWELRNRSRMLLE